MLDSEFLDQIEEIFAACSHPNVQKAVFSATLPANAEKVAFDVLRDPIRVVVGLKYDLRSPVIRTRRYSLSSIEIRLCRRSLNR
jgi:superfamily II DNA/RNA helicase